MHLKEIVIKSEINKLILIIVFYFFSTNILGQDTLSNKLNKYQYGIKVNTFYFYLGNNTSLFFGNEKIMVQGGLAAVNNFFYYQTKTAYGYNLGLKIRLLKLKNEFAANIYLADSRFGMFKRKNGYFFSYNAINFNPTLAYTFLKGKITFELGPSIYIGIDKNSYSMNDTDIDRETRIMALAHLSINLAPLFAKTKNDRKLRK